MSSSFLSTSSPEWPAMWEALHDATGDYADCCPETGECWQYMGTVDGRHEFRHRNRPQTRNGRTTPPIKGYAGQHWGRVYLHLDAETLQVKRLNVQPYIVDTPAKPAPPAKEPPRRTVISTPLRDSDHEDYGGAFDGFNVTSDADPGL